MKNPPSLAFGAILYLSAATFARGQMPEGVAVKMDAVEAKAAVFEQIGCNVFFQWVDKTEDPMGRLIINWVIPNSVASKAGLHPGDRILLSDGKPIHTHEEWDKARIEKRNTILRDKSGSWTLLVQSEGSKETNTLKLLWPTSPPHYGAPIWSAPEGRVPVDVTEPGPLASTAKTILDNGIALDLPPAITHALGLQLANGRSCIGYFWDIHIPGTKTGGKPEFHRAFATQIRGRTEIILSSFGDDHGPSKKPSDENNAFFYLAGPDGKCLKAIQWKDDSARALSTSEADAGCATETNFWLNKIGKGTGQWPLELTLWKRPATG